MPWRHFRQDLFQFLQENDIVPLGHATVDSLVVELMAGGITSEHVGIVRKYSWYKHTMVTFKLCK